MESCSLKRTKLSTENLNCPLCQDLFKDPVTLACGHNFCRFCISHYWRNKEENVPCPVCFLTFYEKRLIDNPLLESQVQQVCCVRHGQRLNLFCETEKALICVECSLRAHKSHTCQPLKETVNIYKETLEASLALLNQRKEFITSTMNKQEQVISSIEQQAKSYEQKIVDEIAKMHQILDEKEKALKKELEEEKTKLLDSMDENVEQLEEALGSLQKDIVTVEEKLLIEDEIIFLKSIFKPVEKLSNKGGESTEQELIVEEEEEEEEEEEIEEGDEADAHSVELAFTSDSASNIPVEELISKGREAAAQECEVMMVAEVEEEEKEELEEGKQEEEEDEAATCSAEVTDTSDQACHIPVNELIQLESATESWTSPTLRTASLSLRVYDEYFQFVMWRTMESFIKKIPESFVLDPETANNRLVLSHGNTSVSDEREWNNTSSKRNNFEDRFAVVGRKEFKSGRHYWEVDVGTSGTRIIGVVKESMNRYWRRFTERPAIGFWTLEYDVYSCVCKPCIDNPPSFKLNMDKIGIYLDYDRGCLSFYDADDMTHIYTFTHKFSETLYPYFYIYRNGKPMKVRQF